MTLKTRMVLMNFKSAELKFDSGYGIRFPDVINNDRIYNFNIRENISKEIQSPQTFFEIRLSWGKNQIKKQYIRNFAIHEEFLVNYQQMYQEDEYIMNFNITNLEAIINFGIEYPLNIDINIGTYLTFDFIAFSSWDVTYSTANKHKNSFISYIFQGANNYKPMPGFYLHFT